MFQTPVLLITFNRPVHTQKVFNAIKKQKPKNLYIFQDGPRHQNEDDIIRCNEVRNIFQCQIDWDCNLKTFYSEKNLGCGPGPVKGITWYFENVEQGIIIEDDTIPADEFFCFAEELLNMYQNENEVKAIASINILNEKYGDGSYYFSQLSRNLCAWATWRRVWKDYQISLNDLTKKETYRIFNRYKMTSLEKEYWYDRVLEIQKDGMNNTCWDIQFGILILKTGGKGICPNKNLSVNIGFDEYATHDSNPENLLAKVKNEKILPLIHPTDSRINRKSDLDYHKIFFQPQEYGLSGLKRLPFRLNKRIKMFFGKEGSWFRLNKK